MGQLKTQHVLVPTNSHITFQTEPEDRAWVTVIETICVKGQNTTIGVVQRYSANTTLGWVDG